MVLNQRKCLQTFSELVVTKLPHCLVSLQLGLRPLHLCSCSPLPGVDAVPPKILEWPVKRYFTQNSIKLSNLLLTLRITKKLEYAWAHARSNYPMQLSYFQSTSTITLKLTRANSGSFEGSNRPSPPEEGGAPSSLATMADEMRASARIGPGGTVTRWLDVPSLPFTAFMNVVKLAVFVSYKRIATTIFHCPISTFISYQIKDHITTHSCTSHSY